jgi:hypothetical protein
VTDHESSELVDLFATYTAGPDSIGAQLARATARQHRNDPLVVATSQDIALYPGGGRPPTVEGFRIGTRGFKELAAVSHLGPAVASLVNLKDGQNPSWRGHAERLLASVQRARTANDTALWQQTIAVRAFAGIEPQIAAMIDYACAVTARYLRRCLGDDSYLTAESLRNDYLAGPNPDLPVPINHMMVATFFLVGMDISHRVLGWFRAQGIDWTRAMVVVAGQQGRPTAGVTWNTSSVATMILGASEGRLPLERMFVAPHAPVFASPVAGDFSAVIALEEPLRTLWSSLRATVELAPVMFEGYPRFVPGRVAVPDLDRRAESVISEMPVIHAPEDMLAMVTRMRVVLEDARQLLSGCVTDYALAQLIAVDNDPSRVVIPGLTGVHYPTQSSSEEAA